MITVFDLFSGFFGFLEVSSGRPLHSNRSIHAGRWIVIIKKPDLNLAFDFRFLD